MFTFEFELKHILVIASLYLLIMIALSYTVRVVPYSRDNMFAIDFPYEGFALNQYVIESKKSPTDGVEQFSEIASTTPCAKVSGFNELFCPPNYVPPANDKFSGTPGGATGNSYGLTNTMGKLKLTNEQINLLNTRGGNSAGHQSEIGI